MDPRAATAIAACVREIAESSATITLIEAGLIKPGTHVGDQWIGDKYELAAKRDRAEAAIAQWFQTPMTFQGVR